MWMPTSSKHNETIGFLAQYKIISEQSNQNQNHAKNNNPIPEKK